MVGQYVVYGGGVTRSAGVEPVLPERVRPAASC